MISVFIYAAQRFRNYYGALGRFQVKMRNLVMDEIFSCFLGAGAL